MENWTTKLSRVAGDVLESGERVVAALFVLPPAGMQTATAIASRSASTGRIASEMPATATVLGLTDRRLLVYGHSSLSDRPEGLKLAMPASDLSEVEIEQRRAVCRFVLHFGDGSETVYEAPAMANDPAPFADAIHSS